MRSVLSDHLVASAVVSEPPNPASWDDFVPTNYRERPYGKFAVMLWSDLAILSAHIEIFGEGLLWSPNRPINMLRGAHSMDMESRDIIFDDPMLRQPNQLFLASKLEQFKDGCLQMNTGSPPGAPCHRSTICIDYRKPCSGPEKKCRDL